MSAANILLVEDDIAFARFIIGSFRDVDPELVLFHVNSGHAAISVMNSGFRPDLVICEDRMPRMTGSELLANVRSDPSYQAVTFLTLTTSFTDDLVAQEGRLPADIRMSRPSNYREALALVNRIRSAMPSESPAPDERQAATI